MKNGSKDIKNGSVIITGTGRTGTTFLMQLLTELGLDTGCVGKTPDPVGRAGLELPYGEHQIFKAPQLCQDNYITENHKEIEFAIIPVRDIEHAARSRINVSRAKSGFGCMWGTEVPERQESVLQGKFYDLFFKLSETDIKIILLRFPKIVEDPEYLYRRLYPIVQCKYDKFLKAFNKIADPTLITCK